MIQQLAGFHGAVPAILSRGREVVTKLVRRKPDTSMLAQPLRGILLLLHVARKGRARREEPSFGITVHGAWHGSWCWKHVRDLLTTAGHRVFTPTLTGLGERSHLLTREVDLETHIADVANLLRWEELCNVVLVGHSYGGTIVRHVADRMPDRIRTLIYLDCFVPEDGQSLNDLQPEFAQFFREQARSSGDGFKMPPVPAAMLGVSAAERAWVDHQCTPHPLSTFEISARLTGACDLIGDIGYVRAEDFPGDLFQGTYARAGERGWWRAELGGGHDVMIDNPAGLASLLIERA